LPVKVRFAEVAIEQIPIVIPTLDALLQDFKSLEVCHRPTSSAGQPRQ
jgi:hypothetical protein